MELHICKVQFTKLFEGSTMLLFFKSTPLTFQLHGFSDASSLANGAVLYLKTIYADGRVTIRIVAAKTHVSPVKIQTIPWLELVAAVVLSRLVVTIRNSLENIGNLETFLWTGSTVVLFWINNHKPWRQYVSSQVTEILKRTSGDKSGITVLVT